MSRRNSIPTPTFTSKATFERLREEDNPGYEQRSSAKKTDEVSNMLGYGGKRTSRDNDTTLIEEDTKAKIARIQSKIEALQAEVVLLSLPEFAVSKFLSKVPAMADPSGKTRHDHTTRVDLGTLNDFGFATTSSLDYGVRNKLVASMSVKLEPTRACSILASSVGNVSDILCRLVVDTGLVLKGALPQRYVLSLSVGGMAMLLRNCVLAFVKSLPAPPKTVIYPTSYTRDAHALVKMWLEYAHSLTTCTALELETMPYLRLDKAIDQVLMKVLKQILPNQTFAFTNRYEVHFTHEVYESL